MVIAVVILVFLVLGLGFACVNLFAYWKKANKERDEAQKAQKEWEAFGLTTKEENEALAKYKPIADIEAHVAKLEGEAGARLASVNEETAQKEAVLREAEAKAMAEVQARIEEAERDSKSRLVTMTSQLVEKEARLKEAQDLLTATRNIVEGYGNEYLVPKESIFDQMAEEYGHEVAGIKLKSARDTTRRMIREGSSAKSQILDPQQNEAAKDFIVDAFNGRIEGILAKAKKLTENYGVLRQQIIDSFNLVNESGRHVGTEITHPFLEARLQELKWAVKVQELVEEEREEQRILKERLRDEALARREAEKARKEAEREAEEDRKMKEAAEKEARRRKELEDEIRAKLEATQRELLAKQKAEATDAEKAKIQEELEKLNAKLEEERKMREDAEGKIGDLEQRIKEAEKKRDTIASDPRGKIYIISNVGSFGEHIYKIGLTRREIEERVKELGDASVPFEFDVHAIIKTNDAPELENKLHRRLAMYRVNKSNWRKEFFKITIAELKQVIEEEGHETSWTMLAKALQFRETQVIEKRIQEDKEFREQWLSRQKDLDLRIDSRGVKIDSFE